MSKADMIAEMMCQRLRSAGGAFRSGLLSAQYRAKPLLPGLSIQIEVHKERLRPRTDRYVRLRDKTDNERVRSLIGSQLPYLSSLSHSPTAYTPMTIFGRFSGPGFTQSGYAVHRIKSPSLFIDKIVIHDTYEVVSCPDRITAMLESPLALIGSFYRVLPWIYDVYETDHDEIRPQIQNDLLRTASCDSFIRSTYMIEGPGEGLIFVPQLPFVSCDEYSQLAFTACTTRSLDLFTTLSQRIGSELAQKIQDFVQKHVTREILEESCSQVVLDRTNTRHVMSDVIAKIKEKQAQLKEYGFPQAEMEHAVGRTAADWFIHKCSKI